MGGKLSRLVYLAPPPTPRIWVRQCHQPSYCSIILEYLVVRDVKIISIKLKWLHPIFSLVILVRGVGGKLSRLVYLAHHPGFGSGSVISQFLLHHYLGIFSFKRCEHYLHPTFSLVSLVRGMLSRLVYLAPCLGFGSNSVISQFLLHHNLGIFSCKRCEHYFSQTEMFTSNIQFGYPCSRGGGQAVQAGLSWPSPRIWVRQCPSVFLLLHNLGIFSCMRYKHYFGQTEMFASNFQFGYPCPRGGWQAVQAGLSFPPPRIGVKQCHQLILIAP